MIGLLSRAADALDALVLAFSGHDKPTTCTRDAPVSTTTTTTRVYTIHYSPTSALLAAEEEDEIVDWHTEIIDSDDGRVQCITTPVYAQRACAHTEQIETTEPLDLPELLARENVCAVTCEEITRTTVSAWTAHNEHENTAQGEKQRGLSDLRAVDGCAELFELHQSAFGMPYAVGCLLRRLLDA